MVLGVSPEVLAKTEISLREKNIPHVPIHDDGELQAIGVVPERRSKLKKHFSSLPLLK